MPTSPEQKAEGWLSVTEVLDTFIPKGLLAWYQKTGAKEAKRLSTVAKKIGSRVDELIQSDIATGTYKLVAKDSIEVKNCMEAWRQFQADYAPFIEAVQVEVKHEGQKVIGHIDLIMDGHVVDVKCSSSIKPNHWIQVAKYASLCEPIMPIAILRLDKNLGTYQFVKGEKAQSDLVQIFDGLLLAHRLYNPPKAVEEEQ